MGADRMYRLWRQEGLQVPKKRPRRRVAASRPRPLPPTAINHVWAYDFVFDTCADGRTPEVPDGHRRVHAGMPGDRRRRRDSLRARHRGPDAARERPRRPAVPALGQRAGVRGAGDSPLAAGRRRSRRRSSTRASRGRTAPTNRSTASCATSTSRCSGSAIASDAKVEHRAVAPALQRGPAALESRVLDAGGVQSETSCRSVDGGRSPAMPARADIRKNEEPLTGPIGAVLQ